MFDYKNLTPNQLKVICKYHGYEIYKRSHRPPRLSCPDCGLKRTVVVKESETGLYYRRCERCGFVGHESKSVNGTAKAWNQAVEEYRLLNNPSV